jgi:hypothetical protein
MIMFAKPIIIKAQSMLMESTDLTYSIRLIALSNLFADIQKAFIMPFKIERMSVRILYSTNPGSIINISKYFMNTVL